MNKKKTFEQINALISKNSELFNDNVALSKENENNKALIKQLEDKIAELETALESAKAERPVTDASYDSENSAFNESDEIVSESASKTAVEQPIEVSDVFDESDSPALCSASAVIGKVVMECAEACNYFTKEGGPNAKDLVNLALGRTEVFKSEILQLVTEHNDFSEMSVEVNDKVAAIEEYFELLKKQL